jgi:hypothetical protein
LLRRRQRIEQDVERQEHQAEPNQSPSHISYPGTTPAIEGDEADQE